MILNSNYRIGKYVIWATTVMSWETSTASTTNDVEYVECLILYRGERYDYYINLNKDEKFPSVSFRFPPPPLKTKIKKNQWGDELEEIIPETEEAAIYREEYRWYDSRKDMQMPMWHLHRDTLEKVIARCHELWEEELKKETANGTSAT